MLKQVQHDGIGGLGRHRLIAHPDTPPNAVASIEVEVALTAPGELWLEFSATPGSKILLPPLEEPQRVNDLWRSTCFELFVRPEGSNGYLEFNFSPSCEWAAYAFDAYRFGMRDLPSRDPEIWISSVGKYFFLAVEALPKVPAMAMKLALSAVIEETDGTKSYWALRHPPGKPDFHHPDCFALELPAPPLP